MESLEALPVVVKKSKRLLEGLAGPSVQERQLCPQGKLLSLIEANGWVRIHDLCNPAIHCLIDSHCYINTLWVNKGSSSLEQSSCQESYLLAINSSKDLHLFSISHIPLDREGENEEKGKLIFVQLAAMSRRQVSSNLSKAQLGSSVEFLRPLGSNKGNIVLLVNENVLLTITSDRVSHQLSFLAIFSIEPNMEEFYDELLPHYVEKISDICISWPLVFTVTGDGIVLVYGIDDGKCIGAINPLEYSRMFCTHHPDSELLVQTLSKSSFQHLSVNPDLSNLAVSTNTNHILLVHIPTYFANFPSHYSKSFQQRPLKRFTQVVRSSQSNLTAEEEERERLVYGGLTPRHKGMGVTHTGTHIGHYTIKNRYKSLKKSVDNFDSNGGLSLARDTVIMDRNQLTDHSSSKGSHQWYVKNSYREGNRSGSIVTPVTNLKPKNIPVTASITSTDISSSSTYPIQCILPPVEDHVTPDSTLFHLDYSRGIVVAYYTEGTDQQILTSDYSVNYIAVYRISHQCYTVIKLPSTSWLVLPANPDKPVFLLSDTSLSLAAFTLSQEDFVAKVLIYGSAGVAEEVCHLNQWDQCSLPLNALETALQLRQLDIVSFFLRNRESSHEGNGVVEESSPAVPPDQLDAAVSLLSNVIKRNHDREHSSQFAGQLLQITLNFLLRFIKSHSNTGSGLSLDEDEAHISPNAITQHIQNLRRYLPHGKQDKPHTLTEEFDHLLQSLIRAEPWHSLSSEEVVEKALINGDVPLVQAFLIQRMLKWKKSPESVDHAPLDDITFDHFNKIGIGSIMKILSNRNIKLATSYISEMGGDVEETVRFIFQHTIQRQLRDNLSAIMSQENWITSNELDALEYLHLLEIYYPNQSYEDAIVIYHGGMHKGMELMYDNKRGNVLDYYPESFGGNHPVVWESVSLSKPFSSKNQKQRGLYIQVPLYVVLLWDSQTRQRVLYEALVYSEASKDMSLCSTLVSLVDQLIYHIKHHNTEASLSLVPLLPPLTVYNLLTSLTHCSHYVKDVLHNSLARNGFYCQPNIETFPELLYRLRQLHNLFSLPHPLSAIDQSNVSLTQFHTLLISYLIEKEFIGLLYLYLDHFKLALDKKSIVELKLDPSSSGIPPWAQLMVQCRLTAENQHEPEYIFSTSLTCSHLLYNSPTVNEGLINGHVFASLATVMYSMHSFDQAMDSSHANELWYIDPVVLKGSLGAYPSLQAAIFPPPPTKLSPAQSQDVTVYELLKGTTKFDISRLFKWQITNKFAAANEDIETQVEPPHFSQSALSHRYSQTDKLSYTYYLYRGQPSFAFANFVAVKLINKTNNTKRIGKVISKVYRLSLSDFTNSHLISSCAAFLEMLSRDSTHLRIDTQSAVRIYEYWFNKIESSEDFASSDADHHKLAIRNKLSSQFLQLYESPDNHMISSSLLDKLIKSTKHVITSNAINACSIEAENYWLLVQQFCKCHSLSPTTSYLKECAREGEWLPMLCHAQLYGISTQEVLNVVEKYFSKPVVKEHLQLAISTMSTTPPPQSPSLSEVSSGSGRGKPRSKRKYMGGLPPNGHTQKKKDEKLPASPVDVRSKFYSRVGLMGHKKEAPPPLEPISINPSITSSLMSPVKEMPLPAPFIAKDLPDDLFTVLFQCQDHSQSWKALLAYSMALQRPLLALLAACYEDSLLIDCMCVWLCTTVGSKFLHKVSETLCIEPPTDNEELHFSSSLQWRNWSEDDFSLLLIAAVLESPSPAGHLPLLFQYFDENNPLYYFTRFHEEFLLRCDFIECANQLKTFMLELDKCHRLKSYKGMVGSCQWVEEVVTAFTNHMIVTCPTPFERMKLLKLLNDVEFGRNFVCHSLDFSQLYHISAILDQAGLSSVPAFKITEQFSPSIASKSLLDLYKVYVRVDSLNILRELVDKGQFGLAREYAAVAEVPIAEVTLKEAESKYHKLVGTSYWQYQPARISFWQKCQKSFLIDSVKPELASEFFESIVRSSTVCSHNENTLLLVLALLWRKRTLHEYLSENAEEEEQEFIKTIWLSHLRALAENTNNEAHQPTLLEMIKDPSMSPLLPNQRYQPPTAVIAPLISCLTITASTEWKEMLTISHLVLPDNVSFVYNKQNDVKSTLNQEECEMLNTAIGRLLNAGYLNEARQLATLFKHDSPDLTIVLCCIQLAQGKLSPDQLTQDVLDLLANCTPHRHTTSPFMSDENRVKNKTSLEIIRMLQQLSDRSGHAHKCCQSIISCFRIAVALHKSYNSVVANDVFNTLAELLSNLNPDKYTLAQLFVSSINMQPKEVAGFLKDCIYASLQCYIGGEEQEYSRVKVYEPQMSSGNFISLVQLCSDHTLLGSFLLSTAKRISKTEVSSAASLSMQVEMVIRSHDCYTLACSVDGIAEVLKLSREITESLYQGKHYKLMVRLLTGVGRFHEMSYIIQSLLYCDEFESLVHHGVEKVEQLRVALMDYLKKNYKHDHEKRQMVALKFGMYRELAKAREDQAIRDIRKLKNKSLGSDSIQILKRIFSDLRDASKIYVENNCLKSAENCSAQAKLVALQLSILQSGKQILNMDGKSVRKFMEEQPFMEALIVADAYKQTLLADWVSPLYKHVISSGDMRYLNEFKSVYTLSPSIVQELASRYLLDRNRSAEAPNNMKKLLAHCANLTLKHKLLHQLALQDDHNNINEGFLRDVAKL